MKRDTIHHSAFLAVFSTLIVLAGLTRTFAKVDRFTVTYFDEMSGLSSNYVNDIEKDDFGFFWLATEKGLVRFDGLNFLEINQQFGLPTLSLTSIERHGNRLSLIFENSSGYIFNLDNHTVLLKMQDPVVDIAWLRQDVLTVLYTSGKIEKLVGYKRVASVTYPWAGATSYLSAANGQLVIGDYYKGVAVLDTGRLSMQATLPLVSDGIKKRPGSNRGDLFFYSNDTLFSLNKDRQLITHGRLSCLPPNTVVTDYFHAKNGADYFIVNANQLFWHENSECFSVTLDLKKNIELRCLYTIGPESFLVGTNQGLVFLTASSKRIRHIEDTLGSSGDFFRVRRKILIDTNGDLLFFGSPYPIRLTADGRFVKLINTTLASYDADWVNGDIISATEGKGVVRINPVTGGVKQFPITYSTTSSSFYAVYFDAQKQQVLFGAELGLFGYSLMADSAYRIHGPFDDVLVKAINKDSATGNYWIGTDNGLFLLDENYRLLQHSVVFPDAEKGPAKVSQILFHSDNRNAWISCDAGVVRVDKRKLIATLSFSKVELLNPRVVSLLEDNTGRIWMATYDGIVVFDDKNRAFIRLDKYHGLLNSEFNYKSASKLPSGELVFGGLNGYDIINPTHFDSKFNSGSACFVTAMELVGLSESKLQLFNRIVPFDNDVNFEKNGVRLYLSSFELLSNLRYRLEYKIDNGVWNRLTTPAINIFFLKPGYHEVLFRGIGLDGIAFASSPFVIHSVLPFYKSVWFFWLMIVLVLLLVVLVGYYKFQVKRRELVTKEQISMDLHDEVGTILTRAYLLAKSDTNRAGSPELVKYLGQALYSLRVYINTITQKTLTFDELVDEIKELFYANCTPFDILLFPKVNRDVNYNIPPKLFRDLKLIINELTGNIVKHAVADKVNYTITAEGRRLRIEVTDNGLFSELSVLIGKGNGIQNIIRRVSLHKGIVDFKPAQSGKGLTILLEFNL